MPKHAEKLATAGFMYIAQRLINKFKQIAENTFYPIFNIEKIKTGYYNSLRSQGKTKG